jgi:uncharacterized protein YqiB (DUF1249 family)
MSQALARKPRIYRPNRFGYLMGLYSENYLRLQRMFRPDLLVESEFRSSVGDGLDLRLDVIERHAYTLELRLTYELCDPVTGQPDPSAFLRLYRDARLAAYNARLSSTWGYSSAGRALQWHCRGHRFDPD